MLWRNRIVRGDLLRLLLALPDACYDAVVTDPPYSSGGAFRADRAGPSTSSKYQNTETERRYAEFAGDTRDQRGWSYWLALWLAECWRVTRECGVVMLFSDWRQLPEASDALQAAGWVWRGIAVWDKTEAARPQRGRFRNQCEYILWGSKGPWWDNEGAPLPGVLRYAVRAQEKEHMTAKPLPVMRWLLSACPAGGVVLDPCAGSGTTGKAAQERGMGWTGFEIVPEIAQIGAAGDWIQRSLEAVQAQLGATVG